MCYATSTLTQHINLLYFLVLCPSLRQVGGSCLMCSWSWRENPSLWSKRFIGEESRKVRQGIDRTFVMEGLCKDVWIREKSLCCVCLFEQRGGPGEVYPPLLYCTAEGGSACIPFSRVEGTVGCECSRKRAGMAHGKRGLRKKHSSLGNDSILGGWDVKVSTWQNDSILGDWDVKVSTRHQTKFRQNVWFWPRIVRFRHWVHLR